MKGHKSPRLTVSSLALIAALYFLCTSPADAQSFTSTYRVTGRSVKATVTPYKSVINDDDMIKVQWKHISEAPEISIFANEKVGPYLILRRYGDKFEGFARGSTMIDHVKKFKIEVKVKEGFNVDLPYVIRWVKTRYEADNEDFEVDKMFKVADEVYFLQFLPTIKKEGTFRKLTYNELETLDSFAFPTRKHRLWKGV